MKKPDSKHSNGKAWKVYAVSIMLQLVALIITLFTKREVTHGFYYSEKQKDINFDMFDMFPEKKTVLFRGKEYTEMRSLEYGWCNWDDSRLVGLGSIDDVQFVTTKSEPR
jgi:hypothetical protein